MKANLTSEHKPLENIATVIYAFGVIAVIAGIGMAVLGGVALVQKPSSAGVALLAAISTALPGLGFIAVSHLIQIMIQIEQNTQATYKLLEMYLSQSRTPDSRESGIDSGKFLIWRTNLLTRKPHVKNLSDDTLYTKYFVTGREPE
jgi:hypothetical protein